MKLKRRTFFEYKVLLRSGNYFMIENVTSWLIGNSNRCWHELTLWKLERIFHVPWCYKWKLKLFLCSFFKRNSITLLVVWYRLDDYVWGKLILECFSNSSLNSKHTHRLSFTRLENILLAHADMRCRKGRQLQPKFVPRAFIPTLVKDQH